MPRSHRKRQKREIKAHQLEEPEVINGWEGEKDEEELQLESMLFGNRNATSILNDVKLPNFNQSGDPGDVSLFFFDSGLKPPVEHTYIDSVDDQNASDDDQPSAFGDLPSREPSAVSGSSVSPAKPASALASKSRRSKKAHAWVDPDDAELKVSLANDNRLRKLRDGPDEDVITGKDYEVRLRRQFERINPVPQWAAEARSKLSGKKRRRDEMELDGPGVTSEDEDRVEKLLQSTAGILSQRKSKVLEKGNIDILRLRDANQSARTEGNVEVVQFHPSPTVSVLLTAGADRRLRLFNIDGHTNPLLQTLHIPTLPIKTAFFHPSGSSVLLTGPRPFFYSYDLQSGVCTRSPRSLWGTVSTSSSLTNSKSDISDHSMSRCRFSPDGKLLAVAGRRGYVHLVDWSAGGAQVIGSVKGNATIKDVWWSRDREGELMALGEDSQIYVWDVRARRCVKRWKDDGGYGGLIMGGDPVGSYVAVGSKSGIVNVYDSSTLYSPSSVQPAHPKPLKALGNLTTAVSSLSFNHDAQLMMIASNMRKDQLRLVHLPSCSVFQNWPTNGTPLGRVTAVDFSTNSGYLAVGNMRGRVLLYNIRHYSD